MLRAVRVATLVGALTVTIAGCGGDDDVAVEAEPAVTQPQAEEAQEVAERKEATEPEAEAEADDGGRAVAFGSTGAPQPAILTMNCNPADAADCILPANYPPTEVTGDLRGTAFSASPVIGRNGVYVGVSLIAFVGEVEGCGTGGLVVTTVGTFDPSSGLTTGEWTVNEDGGTGELADVTGGGTTSYDAKGGRYVGRLRCR